MQSDLFFITRAKKFDIGAIEIRPIVKTKWKERCDRATKPDKYRRSIKRLVDLVGFREGIKILDVGCGLGAQVIELSYLGANCVGFTKMLTITLAHSLRALRIRDR